ncbi:hypothetical protein B0I35DRAFT_402273, partial [Stachybotrys elegans]
MSGGFYKYRCKYFYSHNCPNWVWVNNSPCASCLADGRDEIKILTEHFDLVAAVARHLLNDPFWHA